jgi:hypothetical protein
VDWGFFFGAMSVIGFPNEFTGIVKLLFCDAIACIKVNGALSNSFKIERGVRQGCPITPTYF